MNRNEGFRVQQTNIVIDVLGGYDRKVKDDLNSLLGRYKTNKVNTTNHSAACYKNYEHCTLALDYVTLPCFLYICLCTSTGTP